MVSQTQFSDFARATATVGLGVASGLTLSASAWAVPIFLKKLQPRDRVRAWSQLYDLGKIWAPALVLFATLFSVASFLTSPATTLELFPGVTHRGLFGASSLLAISIIPFTLTVMGPGIKALKNIEATYEGKDKVMPQDVVEKSDKLIQTWNSQHMVRVGLVTAAFIIAVTDLLYFNF